MSRVRVVQTDIEDQTVKTSVVNNFEAMRFPEASGESVMSTEVMLKGP